MGAEEKKVLSHLRPEEEGGGVHMVDVSAKPATLREARAEGFLRLGAPALELALSGRGKKGDVLATAQLAGIMAAKKTADLIPLCHPLGLSKVTVDITPLAEAEAEAEAEAAASGEAPCALRVESLVRVTGQTGVEMEALTAASIACLTLYDMLKAVDKSMEITGLRLLEKSGGRSGHYRRDA